MRRALYLLVLLPAFLKAQQPGDTLFGSSNIHTINILFSQANWWDSLMYYKQHADSFNLSTQSMKADLIIDGTAINAVGIQLKGNSSFGYPGQKKPLKINFNEYVSAQKLEGLTSLNLNNNVLDPTMMREKLMLDMLNKKGFPAPRCTYARLFYNGQYVGLYKMIEQINKQFIIDRFGNWGGNLFKGDPQGTLAYLGSADSLYYPNYELHSNQTQNIWSDLVDLTDKICNTASPQLYDTLESRLNTTPLIGQWAARNVFVDLDAYFHAAHNYYLYHNTASGKFEWCSWDVSVAFGFYPFWKEDSTESTSILMAFNPLVVRMINDPTYRSAYLDAVCDQLNFLDTAYLDPIIDSIANRIYPAFAAEPDSNQMFPEQIFYYTIDTMTLHTPMGDIPALKKFITKRRAKVVAELNSIGWSCPLVSVPGKNFDDQVQIYPNPFTTSATIQSNTPFTKAEVRLFDMFGRLIRTDKNVQGSSFVIDRADLRAGVYVLQIEDSSVGSHRSKLIVTD